MPVTPAVEVDAAAASLHAEALVWDQHCTFPPTPGEDAVDALELYREAGVDVVSVMAASDLTTTGDALKLIASFRRGLQARPDRYLVVAGLADVYEAKRTGKLAVTFNFEGTEPLDGELSMLRAFCELGVRTVSIAYNRRNRAGGGCHDDPGLGLTEYGRALLREMNELGIIVDATHCSAKTTFDLFELSSKPVIFSHSVPAGVHAHDRNVTDDQMRACAATGGVIGINGVALLLGDPDASTEGIVGAIDYAVGIVGPEHVGLGLDYLTDQSWLAAFMRERPEMFPAAGGYADSPIRFVNPAQLPAVTASLLQLGYGEDAVRGIVGGNFLRVAEEVWP
jgi:membrane dipeptidase